MKLAGGTWSSRRPKSTSSHHGSPGSAVLEPVLIEGHGLADGCGVALSEGQDLARRSPPPWAPRRRARSTVRQPSSWFLISCSQASPVSSAKAPPGKTTESRKFAAVTWKLSALQEVRCVLGHGPLRHAEVAAAPHDEAAVEPGLGRHPVERGLPVGLLVAHRDELAPGSERPPAALHDDLVAALRVQPAERPHDRAPVRRADEHGRPARPPAGCVGYQRSASSSTPSGILAVRPRSTDTAVVCGGGSLTADAAIRLHTVIASTPCPPPAA